MHNSNSLKHNINVSKGVSIEKFIIFACWLMITKKINDMFGFGFFFTGIQAA